MHLHPTPEQLVWYVSYGSNLCRERFMCYIQGGTPKGGNRNYTGARNPQPPKADRPLTIDYGLFFAGKSTVWGASPAFIDHQAGTTPTLARGWLITKEQFEDVVAQESARIQTELDPATLNPGETRIVGKGLYDRLICVDYIENIPAITFTGLTALTPETLGPPSVPYLQILAAGLQETHNLDIPNVTSYLAAAPGLNGSPNADNLLRQLTPQTTPANLHQDNQRTQQTTLTAIPAQKT